MFGEAVKLKPEPVHYKNTTDALGGLFSGDVQGVFASVGLAAPNVKAGKLVTLGWDELHQRSALPGQEYSFRYFQQLGGSVMLPKDFTPQRVRISLTGPGGSANQTFDWKLAGSGRGE